MDSLLLELVKTDSRLISRERDLPLQLVRLVQRVLLVCLLFLRVDIDRPTQSKSVGLQEGDGIDRTSAGDFAIL